MFNIKELKRDLEFRVWDNNSKTMVYSKSNTFQISDTDALWREVVPSSSDYSQCFIITGDTQGNIEHTNWLTDVVLMQFTGMSDSDKKIFEGDIVCEEGEYIGIVKWDNDDLYWKIDYINTPNDDFSTMADCGLLTVIGNIFETKTLDYENRIQTTK